MEIKEERQKERRHTHLAGLIMGGSAVYLARLYVGCVRFSGESDRNGSRNGNGSDIDMCICMCVCMYVFVCVYICGCRLHH